jgi:tripartite-type tricarboxylate transporter receptor subunit TctC
MKLPRRKFLHLAAGAVALPALSRVARAQSYPTRPVHIVVGYAPGSAADILSRLIGKSLSERLGQPFVIENRGGAGGTLGAETVVRAPPDGYTLLFCGSPDTFNATLYDKLNFNFIRDIVPVAGISRGPLVLVVRPSFPAKTIPEFIAYTKANPNKVNFASAGIGTVAHMAGELFMAMAGVKLVHVPYRGLGQAMTDLLGGQVQAILGTTLPSDQWPGPKVN